MEHLSKNLKETRKCHFCGKPGHLKKDCWKRQREEQGAGSSQGQRQRDHGRGAQGNVACAAVQTNEGEAWVLDSGASRHIAMSRAGMSNLRPVSANTSITFGNDSKASVEAVGDVVLRIPGSEVETLTLTDVYLVPEARMNLFSIPSAVKRGVEVLFSSDQTGEYCTMRKGGKLLARGDAYGGISGRLGHAAHVAMSATETLSCGIGALVIWDMTTWPS